MDKQEKHQERKFAAHLTGVVHALDYSNQTAKKRKKSILFS